MVDDRMQPLLAQLRQQGIQDERVLQAMSQVPREDFVDLSLKDKAYENKPLPIESEQTISQPYIVARMTELLKLTPTAQVLEIGTGSGYQTAVLAHLAQHVFSIERIKALQSQAERRFKQLGLQNISTKYADGWLGWRTHAPFQAILVTAAAAEVPHALLEQLEEGGRLVLPVGDTSQILKSIQRCNNEYLVETLEAVRFVPLIKGTLA